MAELNSIPENTSDELARSFEIIQSRDRSNQAYDELLRLYESADENDQPKIAEVIDVFIASNSTAKPSARQTQKQGNDNGEG